MLSGSISVSLAGLLDTALAVTGATNPSQSGYLDNIDLGSEIGLTCRRGSSR